MFYRIVIVLFSVFAAVNGDECFEASKVNNDKFVLMCDCFDNLVCKEGRTRELQVLLDVIGDEYLEDVKAAVFEVFKFELTRNPDWKDFEGSFCRWIPEYRKKIMFQMSLQFEDHVSKYECLVCGHEICEDIKRGGHKFLELTDAYVEEGICY